MLLAVVLIIFNKDVLRDTFNSFQEIPLIYLGSLIVIATTLIFARGALVAATIPQLSIRRAALADQAALSAAYGIAFGGGAVGVAAKVTMFQRWSVPSAAIGASLVATAVIPTFTTWGPTVVIHLPMLVLGDASRIEALVVIIGILTIGFNILFWAGVLYLNGPIHKIASISQWTQRFLVRVIPVRLKRTHKAIHTFDIKIFVHSTKDDLRTLISERFLLILFAAFTVTSLSLAAFFVSLHAVSIENVSVIEALSAFALVRVIIALSPLPGGIGLAEISLVALLTNAGASEVEAIGATLLYRAVVWLTPIIVGGVGWWLWSRRQLWTPTQDKLGEPSSDDCSHSELNLQCMECHRCHPQKMSCERWSDFLATSQ